MQQRVVFSNFIQNTQGLIVLGNRARGLSANFRSEDTFF